ncbi:hypothetical protein GCM10009740_39470 [Terrabacter terrae]|uniref:Uncharacterized protein n=1 Tax=Terrabacter terrae TaxID=318434 RepID=A0ABN1ZTJ1_9MICO
MSDCNFRTNAYKNWRQLHVVHSREWESEPGHVRPQTFTFAATDTQTGRTGSVTLQTHEAIALRDWLSEHLKE